MTNPPKSEGETWLLAYGLATALLTLGTSIRHGVLTDVGVTKIDKRARQIANNAIAAMKEKDVI